jgi:hypothetical protein
LWARQYWEGRAREGGRTLLIDVINEIKFSMFTNDMILYGNYAAGPTVKVLEISNEFSKVAGCDTDLYACAQPWAI